MNPLSSTQFNVCILTSKRVDSMISIGRLVKTAESSASALDKNLPCLDILSEFPNITKSILLKKTPSHYIVHHIETTGPPVFATARPLQSDRYRREKEFQIMIDMEICTSSKNPYAGPLHVVSKKDRQIRPCGDN
ncbi:hypothetical protein EVAR_92922_1 [Eumeta japonica]|uniref:Uncharacterized protein n=1 Tax=Eumeta variegata TaxID=151549 RepID=A0A4C1TBA9_EUMVA|nr:hypothetical protein EVAR_92922_1 [Eumeta japonica]